MKKWNMQGLVEKGIAYNYRDYFMVGECVRFLITPPAVGEAES